MSEIGEPERLAVLAALVLKPTTDELRLAEALRGGGMTGAEAEAVAGLLRLADGSPLAGPLRVRLREAFLDGEPQAPAAAFAYIFRRLALPELDGEAKEHAETLLARLPEIFRDEMRPHFREQLLDLWEGRLFHQREVVNYALDGSELNVHLQFSVFPGHEEQWDLVLLALTELLGLVWLGDGAPPGDSGLATFAVVSVALALAAENIDFIMVAGNQGSEFAASHIQVAVGLVQIRAHLCDSGVHGLHVIRGRFGSQFGMNGGVEGLHHLSGLRIVLRCFLARLLELALGDLQLVGHHFQVAAQLRIGLLVRRQLILQRRHIRLH